MRPVVHAVLFYSPTCGHCQYVVSETLLPLTEEYGDQLQILGVDVTQSQGQTLYLSTLRKFNLEQGGVPFLVIDNIYLFGSKDIPERFPALVETYLSQGGVSWPDLPGLQAILTQFSEGDGSAATITAPGQSGALQVTTLPAAVTPTFPSPMATAGFMPPNTRTLDWRDKFALDQTGNMLSVLVLAGMLASVAWAGNRFQKTTSISLKGDWAWLIPLVCAIGFGVAGYLAYVETAQVTAVCGPVGDCNTVQQSDYARLFGIVPIGILGMIGYAVIVIAWLIARNNRGRLADLAALSLFVMTIFGTLFSIYLTYLEPFVIGATCAWCLTSSVLITMLMLLSVGPARAAFSRRPFSSSLRRRHVRSSLNDD